MQHITAKLDQLLETIVSQNYTDTLSEEEETYLSALKSLKFINNEQYEIYSNKYLILNQTRSIALDTFRERFLK